jgi:enoyl-CoA hydratase
VLQPDGSEYAVNSDEVRYEVRDRVAYITINRPERRNALSYAVMTRLVELFASCNGDPDVWAIVITGTGGRAFSAGGDLKEMDERARQGLPIKVPMSGAERNVNEALLETYKPTIATLNGHALAGGLELALAADIRIAADHITVGMPKRSGGWAPTSRACCCHA